MDNIRNPLETLDSQKKVRIIIFFEIYKNLINYQLDFTTPGNSPL